MQIQEFQKKINSKSIKEVTWSAAWIRMFRRPRDTDPPDFSILYKSDPQSDLSRIFFKFGTY